MRLAVDVNRYRDFVQGDPDVVERFEMAQEIWLPFVALAELRAGFLFGRRSTSNERILQRFLQKPGVGVLFADSDTTHHYARLYRQLRQQGTPIPTNDLWIAALVVQHDLILDSRDRHFDHLPQLPRA